MREKPSSVTRVLPLLTLTVFALCVLLVLLISGSVYRNLVDRGEKTYARRTALQYLTTRVRQAETVETGQLEGCEALVLGETVDGEVYTTHIYCHGGWLRELYAVPGAVLPADAGTEILEGSSFSVDLSENLLRICFEGEELLLHLPGGRMVEP